jgi:hypothetical protein
MIKFGLTILTMKILNIGDGHGQLWIDHFDHITTIWPNGQKIVVSAFYLMKVLMDPPGSMPAVSGSNNK